MAPIGFRVAGACDRAGGFNAVGGNPADEIGSLTERSPTRTSPPTKLGTTPFAPRSGERSFVRAASMILSLRALHTWCTAEPALAAPHEPPEPAVRGKRLSPSTTLTAAMGTPRLSAAIWVRMV